MRKLSLILVLLSACGGAISAPEETSAPDAAGQVAPDDAKSDTPVADGGNTDAGEDASEDGGNCWSDPHRSCSCLLCCEGKGPCPGDSGFGACAPKCAALFDAEVDAHDSGRCCTPECLADTGRVCGYPPDASDDQ